MRNKNFGVLVRSALAATLLVGTQWAAAEVVTGTIVKFADGVGNNPGGAFNGSVVSGGVGTWNNSNHCETASLWMGGLSLARRWILSKRMSAGAER